MSQTAVHQREQQGIRSRVLQPSSGIATVGFDTYFEFPSGAVPSMSEGGSAVDMVSFVVKKAAGAGGTELLASAGLNYQ